jgi:integrase
LSFHPPSGRLYKTIRGRRHYFGYAVKNGGWQAALDKYQEQRDDLHAGRTPHAPGDGTSIKELLNRFLTAKTLQVETGEITHRSFVDYKRVTDRIIAVFGPNRAVADLRTEDFETLRAEIAKRGGLVYLAGEIRRTRVVFNYAWQAGLIDAPARFGPMFKPPKKAALRKEKQANGGSKMYEPDELRTILEAAGQPLRAMILLGLNAGMGNADVGQVPIDAMDLDAGWITFPRPKTGIERRIPLWPETSDAIKAWLAVRPEPKDAAAEGLVFVTRWGGPWHVDDPRSPVSFEFAKLLRKIDTATAEQAQKNGTKPRPKLARPRRGFYGLRHVFQTVGEESGDVIATRHIMGHAVNDVSAFYRERVLDSRLRAVVNHVRAWLFADGGQQP